MSDADEVDHDQQIVKAAAEKLAEHFDSVRIFVTRHEPAEVDGTIHVEYGLGNWYAGYGQIVQWLDVERDRLAGEEEEDDD